MLRSFISEIIAFLFIILFVYAALSKLLDYDQFVIQLGQSPAVNRMGPLLSFMVPATEIMFACLLCFSRLRLAGLYLSFMLMVMFTSYIIYILYYSPFVPCSCGGVLEKMTWKQHLLFNVAFVCLGIAGVLLQPDPSIKNESKDILLQ